MNETKEPSAEQKRPQPLRGASDGVGLGLSLVRQIARHHEGDARCLAREDGAT